MREQVKRAGAATIATAAAVALTAGLTSPASATPRLTGGAGATGTATAPATTAAAGHRITLITGDRVVVDAKGRVLGLEPAEGREHIPVQVRRAGGHTLVVPADAARLMAEGKLDQRLFDITVLNRSANRKAQRAGLKVIVGYQGTASGARADVRDAGDTQVRRTLKALNADAVQTPKDDAHDLWKAVTDGDGTAASGIAAVWLDGVRKVNLDKSVPQIGAPKAWASGYDGKGVTIAVLDTGVDATHKDLKGRIAGARNFTTAAGTNDAYGHGTHVASIAVGTGAASGGRYKGVAPGAKVLNGKVLDDSGYGDDSGILAGMEWAAAQGAEVVNLSLGGGDTAEIDPLEAQINKLSAEKGILFAVAAGNEGAGEQTVGSPGSAAAALTVGAVDGADRLADFSSRGPGLDGQVKPDVTAPGVDITAASAPGSVIAKEVGESPAGYVTISGTSMATPHVAGAAAILKQRHPEWTYAELKGALTASAKGGGYSAFQQGAGRVQVDKALTQTVIAEPVSVSFGTQQWPHTDDTPQTEAVTYRNLGEEDVTLKLAATGTGPKGQVAPAGFFTLGADTVTVPAGGTASVGLTVNTKLGGSLNGAYSAYVTATGGGQSVRTAVGVQREAEAYDVTLKVIGRNGRPTAGYDVELTAVSGTAAGRWYNPYDADGTVTVRVPKGGYNLNSGIYADPEDLGKGVDWLAQPKLSVTRNTTVTLDARKAKPVRVTVPDAKARAERVSVDYSLDVPTGTFGFSWTLRSFEQLRTAHLGPQVTGADGRLTQQWAGHWTKGGATEYNTVTGGPVKQLATGYTKHWKQNQLSTVKVNMGASSTGKKGSVTAYGYLPGGGGGGIPPVIEQKLPGTRTLYLSATGGVKWDLAFDQIGGRDKEGWPVIDASYALGAEQTFKAGKTYTHTFNVGVFGPRVGGAYGVRRDGNEIYGNLPLFADGKGHAGGSLYSSVTSTLYRNGKKVITTKDPLDGSGQFKVPAAQATYQLKTSVKRSAKVAAASTRIDTSWTFTSKKTASDTALPVSTARFGPSLDLGSRAAAGKKVTVPVTVQGAAAGRNLKSLAVYVSYDAGKKWTKVTVTKGKVSYKNPAKGKGIALRAAIADKKGNKSSVTIYNAYHGK
ncbi:S8 family peptidase [Streptomyces sp. CRN 30]|uniref:S8 family peptidase n=1 Tax=Streptomyces sp. CRN 30 TaxID=3075613 RepID=UPI002A7F04AB|nr:S8 family peptidase [Streptomyces sp. CRN 30]